MNEKQLFAFENTMDRGRTLLGWLYFPFHVLILPLLLGLMSAFPALGLSEADANLIYYAIGVVFCLTAMWPFLRTGFDRFLDRPGRFLFSLLVGLALTYLLSNLTAAVLLLFEGGADANPNNAEVMALAQKDYGKIKAISLFLAPIVEEVLFRGVVFGSLRARSRFAAYAASVLLFSFYHVWQAAVAYADPGLLLYAVQYLPVSVALTRVYERSGSIWASICFHMCFNAVSFAVLGM